MRNPALRIHRQFNPVQMGGCVLYLPLYRYGAEQTVIPDLSGNGNHGTLVGGSAPGTYPVLSPAELVLSNPGFDADTDWDKGTGWSIAAGVATKVAGVASNLNPTVPLTIEAGKTYRVYFEENRTSAVGTLITPQVGGVNGEAKDFSANGGTVDSITATGTGNLLFQADAGWAGYIDNVSVKEVRSHEARGWAFDWPQKVIRVSQSASLNVPPNFSALAWIYAFGVEQSGGGVLCQRDGVAGASSYTWYLKPGPTHPIAIFNQAGVIIDGPSVPLNRWSCVGLSASGRNETQYCNEETPIAGDLGAITQVTSLDLFVGCRGNGTGTYQAVFTGNIGEVALFNRAFSTKEFRDFYQRSRRRYGV